MRVTGFGLSCFGISSRGSSSVVHLASAGGYRAARVGGPALMRRQVQPQFLLVLDKFHLWLAMPKPSGQSYWRVRPQQP